MQKEESLVKKKKAASVKDIVLSLSSTFDRPTRERYEIKKKLIHGVDPYEIKEVDWSSDAVRLPDISYPDIVNYLVNKQSSYTLQKLKAYKSLESYNYFISGFVRDVRNFKVAANDFIVVKAKVQHSQRLREGPLLPWLISRKDGEVLAAHCTCMAGLGEACSHVGALLFAIEATVKLRNSKTVTQEKAYWVLPTALHKAEYKEIREIDFTSSKTKKQNTDKKIDQACHGIISQAPSRAAVTATFPANKSHHQSPSTEFQTLFESLHSSGSKPAILSLIPLYADQYVPKSLADKYPVLLSELQNDACLTLPKEELLHHCKTVSHTLTVTREESQNLEQATVKQAECKQWHQFRTGRVTASRLKAVCKTSLTKPSLSLINQICYPQLTKFTSAATKWGCQHEQDGRQMYESEMVQHHDNFNLRGSGLVISPAMPFLGASPDGITHCDCCGDGCLEVKCPYCEKFQSFHGTLDKKHCLERVGGKLQLKRSHHYYYQVQCQMHVCQKEFCDFVIWTEQDFHIERIEPDHDFWIDVSSKAEMFFNNVILLELVGQYFSRPSQAPWSTKDTCITDCQPSHENQPGTSTTHCTTEMNQNNIQSADTRPVICICNKRYDPTDDSVIRCDNVDCPYVWLHYECVDLTYKRIPKGKWYCHQCCLLPKFQKPSRKRKLAEE